MLKQKDEFEFECFSFEFSTGEMKMYLPFNEETAFLPNGDNFDPIDWVWFSEGENMILKDRRDVEHTEDREEYKKLYQYNDYCIKLDGSRSAFFECLANLEETKDDQKSISIPFYENEVRLSIHDATKK